MATVGKLDAALQRKFAEVAARLRRADIVSHVLGFALFVISYAFAFGLFEAIVGASASDWVLITRWVGYAIFVLTASGLAGLTVRSATRTINPYFIAQQIERASPEAKNGLINWLDLHDEDLPAAFQKHLGMRAADQWDDADTSSMTRSPRGQWITVSWSLEPDAATRRGARSIPSLEGLAVLSTDALRGG